MEPVSSNSIFYAGEFRHRLDDKHRVTIPSRWRRNGEAEEFLMVPEPNHQFLLVMPPDEFARVSSSAAIMPGVTARDLRVFLRHLHARAQHGLADKQGRLLLPDNLCKELELKGEVALVGGRGRFEIWNRQRWQRAHADEQPTYQHVANLVGL